MYLSYFLALFNFKKISVVYCRLYVCIYICLFPYLSIASLLWTVCPCSDVDQYPKNAKKKIQSGLVTQPCKVCCEHTLHSWFLSHKNRIFRGPRWPDPLPIRPQVLILCDVYDVLGNLVIGVSSFGPQLTKAGLAHALRLLEPLHQRLREIISCVEILYYGPINININHILISWHLHTGKGQICTLVSKRTKACIGILLNTYLKKM